MVFLVESGFAQQTDVARAFDRSVRTVRRHQARYVQGWRRSVARKAGAPAAAVVIPANASCALSAGVEGPTSLRIAFSLTPSRCATARLLIPWLFSSSMLRRRCPEIRRRPRRRPKNFSTSGLFLSQRRNPLLP
jgi:hypothetical protein